MYIALNERKERIHIKQANFNEKYYCPLCEYELSIKDGDIRQKHFAHKRGAYNYCDDVKSDDWKSDMSDWHREWQERFPVECQEVVLMNNGEKHRADVKVGNVVVEFQHSPISREAFEKRNKFYTSAGYKLIWLFDLSEDYEDTKYITPYIPTGHYNWKYHRKNFNGFNLSKNTDIIVFFQLRKEPDKDRGIVHLTSLFEDCREFGIELDVDYTIDEFVDYINHYEERHRERGKEKRTLYEILEDSDKDVMIVQNENTYKRYFLKNIPRKKAYMKKHPYNDVWGYICYDESLGYYEKKEYPLKPSGGKVWTVVWSKPDDD